MRKSKWIRFPTDWNTENCSNNINQHNHKEMHSFSVCSGTDHITLTYSISKKKKLKYYDWFAKQYQFSNVHKMHKMLSFANDCNPCSSFEILCYMYICYWWEITSHFRLRQCKHEILFENINSIRMSCSFGFWCSILLTLLCITLFSKLVVCVFEVSPNMGTTVTYMSFEWHDTTDSANNQLSIPVELLSLILYFGPYTI